MMGCNVSTIWRMPFSIPFLLLLAFNSRLLIAQEESDRDSIPPSIQLPLSLEDRLQQIELADSQKEEIEVAKKTYEPKIRDLTSTIMALAHQLRELEEDKEAEIRAKLTEGQRRALDQLSRRPRTYPGYGYNAWRGGANVPMYDGSLANVGGTSTYDWMTYAHTGQYNTAMVARVFQRHTGRALLLTGKSEEPGFGLYSYLLLRKKPVTEEHGKSNLAAISAYVELFADIDPLLNEFERSSLNIFYLPVREAGLPNIAATLLDGYDFERSEAWLRRVPNREIDRGPYLISVLKPLPETGTIEGKYLIQDLSGVPPHLVRMWVKEFGYQTSKREFWNADKMRTLAVNLRTGLGILARGVDDAKAGLIGFIDLIKLLGDD